MSKHFWIPDFYNRKVRQMKTEKGEATSPPCMHISSPCPVA